MKAKATVEGLFVTNDHAERGVALVKEFTRQLTKDEEQFQYLLQVVASHRTRMSKGTKQALTGQQ